MPELAHRVEAEGLDMRVADCRFRDAPGLLWSPTHRTPPPVRDRDYLAQGRCRIPTQDGCAVDERTDLELSTAASIHTLSEAWDDPVLRDSGASVVITILSHNAGYDDSRYGVSRSTNLLPAFRSWSADHDRGDWHRFYGDNVRCDRPDPPEGGRCGSVLPAETQHYGYRIVATHLVAVCYYGLNYGTEPAFSPWVRYTRGDGYCTGLEIPTAEQVSRH